MKYLDDSFHTCFLLTVEFLDFHSGRIRKLKNHKGIRNLKARAPRNNNLK